MTLASIFCRSTRIVLFPSSYYIQRDFLSRVSKSKFLFSTYRGRCAHTSTQQPLLPGISIKQAVLPKSRSSRPVHKVILPICCENVSTLQASASELCFCGKEEEQGVKYANKCEVCKIVSTELTSKLTETGKSSDVIETGYSLEDKNKKRTKYKSSELRLVETLDNICERILQYNIHKERSDSTRFAKGMSQTFQTLHGLVNKGVKVELGMPYELWDKPSAEITNMKTQCETLVEDFEEDIEEWYFHQQQNISLQKFLCSDRVLKDEDDSCLSETEASQRGKIETKNEL